MKAGNSMNLVNKKKGFTLIELIVAIAVMGIVVSMVFEIFSSNTKMYSYGIEVNDVQQSGMLCLNRISEGIRLSSSALPYDPAAPLINLSGLTGSSKPIIQIIPSDGSAAYQYVINNNILYKYINSTSYSPIASNVNKVTVTLSGSVYTIYIEILNGSSVKTFSTNVSKRNRGV